MTMPVCFSEPYILALFFVVLELALSHVLAHIDFNLSFSHSTYVFLFVF